MRYGVLMEGVYFKGRKLRLGKSWCVEGFYKWFYFNSNGLGNEVELNEV